MRETGRRLSGNRFFHSQIKHWVNWQISTLMRFFERPGRFVGLILSHIKHFFNAFQPIAYRSPAVCAAMSGSGSRSTYRSKAILRSTLPSGALLMAAVICCRSSPCSAAGSTTRAAATGSTEPKRLRQLSGVAYHIANDGKTVTKRHQFAVLGNMVRNAGQLPQPFWLGAARGGGSCSAARCAART